MMRASAAVLALVGCGRIGFDDVATATDAAIDVQPVGCPADYAAIGTLPHRYKSIGQLTQNELSKVCSEQGTLPLRIEDATENMAVLLEASGKGGILRVGIEGSTDGQWRTVTNEVATYLPWATGAPNQSPQPNVCVVMRLLNPEAGMWLTDACDQAVGRASYCECVP